MTKLHFVKKSTASSEVISLIPNKKGRIHSKELKNTFHSWYPNLLILQTSLKNRMLLPTLLASLSPTPPLDERKENLSCTAHLLQSFSAYRHKFPKGYDKPGDRSHDCKISNSTVKHFIPYNIWEQFKRKSQKLDGMGEE